MLTKQTVRKTIDKLPESFSLDQLIDELIFTQKVEKGLLQSTESKVISKSEAKTKLKKWLK